MLSDKEKKVIDLLKNIDKQKCVMLECPVVKNNIKRQLKIIELNRTIRKQSKEIEELKNGQIDFWISDKEIEERIRNKFVSKDKIKAKIEEFKKVRDVILENENEFNRPMMTYDLKRNDYCEKMLQSLLDKE